ncbi:hypothetical protein GRI44_13060 [Altererythrobacter confluentis]|uniref:Uncharacterized protein n=1 Tax=Allopontixanthobacter confluentis TaxID=1849021 RepID=A0A6L7GIC3_9SPHN|nr:hypothetical protein [Allopontixanthobacter confluentis]MXP15679.1 hypothetical protein [Allopontixanthobacter confluentis]
MKRGSYFGGSTEIGPGSKYWWPEPGDRKKSRKIDPETQAIMDEHDRLRALGRDPMAELKEQKKAYKAEVARRRRAKKKAKTSNHKGAAGASLAPDND